jgi:hypothetical protein
MSQILDQKSLLNFEPTILPQAATGDKTGVTVDTLGYDAATAFCQLDDAATGSFKLQDSDASGSGFADVADDLVITSDGSNDTAGVASEFVSIGYIGTKRYLRVFFTHTGSGDIAAGILLGSPQLAPTGANS